MSVCTTATFIHLLAMFGPWAPNGYLLASIPPLGDIYIYFLSACSPCLGPGLRTAICLRRFHSFSLAASPTHGDIPSALRSRPLSAKTIFYPLTANVDLNFLTPPHGEIDFLFASRRMSILFFSAPSRQNRFSIHLTADVVFITLLSPHGDISFAPHGFNQFSLWLMTRTDFILILR